MLTFEVFYDSKSFVHIKAFKNSSCKFVTVFFLCEPVVSRCFQILYVTSNCFHFIDILSFHSNNYEYHLNMWVTFSLAGLCTCTCILNSYFVLVNVHHLAMLQCVRELEEWPQHVSRHRVFKQKGPGFELSVGHFSNSIACVPLLVTLNGNQQFLGFSFQTMIYIYIRLGSNYIVK